MKRNGLFVLVLALAAVLCTGCGVKDEDLKSDPLVNADGTAPVGSTLVAPAPQDDFVLLDNKDILSANGLYYASWVNGDAQPYENSEGKTVDLYDAQLTLVVQENKTEDKAASAVEGWQTLGQRLGQEKAAGENNNLCKQKDPKPYGFGSFWHAVRDSNPRPSGP